MPDRKYQAGTESYRYSINGQEKEKELNENITTALYWEYDSRIGRRWNLDPKPAVGISEYSTFGNNPILNSDMLGDSPPPSLEHKYWYIGKIPEFKYNGTISDAPVENVPNAVANGVIKVVNLIPELWNSGVKNVQTLREGTWLEQTGGELKSMYNSTSDAVAYPFNNPFNQWGPDFFKAANNPNTLATGVSIWFASKIPASIGSSQNVSKVFHSTTSTSAADNILTGIDPRFFTSESRFGKGFYVSTEAQTTVKELAVNGSKAAATIGFNLDKPVLLNATGKMLDLATHMAPKMMGGMARSLGFDGLIYKSVVPGTAGVNVVLFKNFQKLTNGIK